MSFTVYQRFIDCAQYKRIWFICVCEGKYIFTIHWEEPIRFGIFMEIYPFGNRFIETIFAYEICSGTVSVFLAIGIRFILINGTNNNIYARIRCIVQYNIIIVGKIRAVEIKTKIVEYWIFWISEFRMCVCKNEIFSFHSLFDFYIHKFIFVLWIVDPHIPFVQLQIRMLNGSFCNSFVCSIQMRTRPPDNKRFWNKDPIKYISTKNRVIEFEQCFESNDWLLFSKIEIGTKSFQKWFPYYHCYVLFQQKKKQNSI